MNSVSIFEKLSHHGYVLLRREGILEYIKSVLSKADHITDNTNPDFFFQEYQSFGIDEAREIRMRSFDRPISDKSSKIFIMGINGITVEAANSLLKIFEEPPTKVLFFLIVPSFHILLPTLRSRLVLVDAGHNEPDVHSGTKFLNSDIATRLKIVKDMCDKLSKDNIDKEEVNAFVDSIIFALREKDIKGNAGKIQSILEMKKYIGDRSPSIKMLLEFMALNT